MRRPHPTGFPAAVVTGMLDVAAYLARIGYDEPVRPDLATLRRLQVAHLMTVPFENLDVEAGVDVAVDPSWSIPKIVDRRRGGWCFELNGAFGVLLEAVGFDVTRASARVAGADGLGPDLDHLVLIVAIDGGRWLVDVGFGDSPLVPVSLDTADVQPVAPRRVRIEATGERFRVFELTDGSWALTLDAGFAPRQLEEFAPRSLELRTTPGLSWTTKRFATRATDEEGGRVFLLTDRLKIRTADGTVTERPVTTDEWDDLLFEHFGIRWATRTGGP